MSSYAKPFLSFEDQLELLAGRGLTIEDPQRALHLLRTVGYYTLGGYLYPMRQLMGGARTDHFLPGASFAAADRLYTFDRRLRLLCLEALETIERRLKVAVAYHLGSIDSFAHSSGSLHNQDHLRPVPGRKESAHAAWLRTHHSKISGRSHDSIKAFVGKYGTPLPIWVAVDAMDFGDVSKLVGHLARKQQTLLANEFSMRRGRDFASWVRTLCFVRNVSAHHDRLWNRELVDVPTTPKGPEAAFFVELDTPERWHRTYAALLITSFLLRGIEPTSDWPARMGDHLTTLPVGPGVTYKALGAPEGWESSGAWQ